MARGPRLKAVLCSSENRWCTSRGMERLDSQGSGSTDESSSIETGARSVVNLFVYRHRPSEVILERPRRDVDEGM